MLRLSRMLSGGYLLLALLITLVTLFVGPLGWAPFQLATIGPGSAPVVVTVVYSTEKEQWLKDAATRFAATNPRIGGRAIQIVLEGKASREMVTDIVQGSYQPTVVSPASMMQVDQLRTAWMVAKGAKGGMIIAAEAPKSLVITPLVLLAWRDRAAPIEQASPNDYWGSIQSALVASGGRMHFGHTNPETSNSGFLTLLLLADGYGNMNEETAKSPAFLEWLRGVERAVPQGEDSTGTLATDMLRFGPSKYDFVAVYENLAIGAMELPKASENGGLHVFYPPTTVLSEHPYALLNAPWVTPEQSKAAIQFRDFLLSREIQQLALQQYGFRPASPQVQITPGDTTNPFVRYADRGVQIAIPNQLSIPADEVTTALIAAWKAASQ